MQFKEGLYSKLFVALTKDLEDQQPQQQNQDSKDQLDSLMKEAIEAYREPEGDKLLAMSSQLDHQKNVLAAKREGIDSEMTLEMIIQLSVSKVDKYEDVQLILREEKNKDDVAEFLSKQIQTMNAQNQAAQAKLGGQIEVLTQENSDLKQELTDHKSLLELLAAEMSVLKNDVAELKTLKADVSKQNTDIASIKEND